MTLTVPNLIFSSAESLISGYLLREVSKLVHSHTTKMFDKALHILENKGSYKKISALDPDGNALFDYSMFYYEDGPAERSDAALRVTGSNPLQNKYLYRLQVVVPGLKTFCKKTTDFKKNL